LSRIAVWGDGAVGTGLAVALSAAGHHVILVGPAGSGRGEITVISSGYLEGSARLAHLGCGESLEADVSLLAVKAYDLGEVAGPASGAAPRILCVMNGMGLADEWGAGWNTVERAVLTAGFQRLDESRVRIVPGHVTVRRGGLAHELFASAEMELTEVDDIHPELWAKWLTNSVVNPFGALSGAANSDLYDLGLEEVMKLLLSELESVVPERYRETAAGSASRMISFLTSSSPNRCSMLQDLEAGSRTEIDYLTGYAATVDPDSCPLARLLSDLVRARSSLSRA
jgi:2-dehydropantoate 2-reductase